MRFIILVAIFGLMLTACTVPIANLSSLNYGMTPVQAHRVTMGFAQKADKNYHFTLNGKQVFVERYTLMNGDEFYPYYLSYQDGRLIYWGRLHEYGRVDDASINAIGKKIKQLRLAETGKPNRHP